MQEFFDVGAVTGTHGLKGEVKVFTLSDDPYRFESLEKVIFSSKHEERELTIERVRYFKQTTILKFKGLDRIEDVERMKGGYLRVRREDALPLEEGEYYTADLIGMDVFLEDGTKLGTLSDVLQTGANDVYAVRTETGKEVLIPAIADCILTVEVEAQKMTVHLLDGLMD